MGSMQFCKVIQGSGIKVGSLIRIKAPVKSLDTFKGNTGVSLGMLMEL